MNANENVLGYGPDNPYQPPLYVPPWLLSILDRHVLLTFNVPLVSWSQAIYAFWVGIGNGDSWDGFFYNNSTAAGT